MCCKHCKVKPCILSCAYRYLKCDGNENHNCKRMVANTTKNLFFKGLRSGFIRTGQKNDNYKDSRGDCE